MRIPEIHTLLLSLGLAISATAAQEAPETADTPSKDTVYRDDHLELEDLVITTTTNPRPLKQTPVSVSLMDRRTIEASPARNVNR